MRSELQEPANHLRSKTTRRERQSARRTQLEPTAIDAAFADDAMPLEIEPMLRRDPGSDPLAGGKHGAKGDAALLDSLRVQLHALEEQHAQIRRLLSEAGHWRVDPAVR
jgi:hypothetical protein